MIRKADRIARELYPWTAYRVQMENVRPYYDELRNQYDMPAGPRTWHHATQYFRSDIEHAERKAYGY